MSTVPRHTVLLERKMGKENGTGENWHSVFFNTTLALRAASPLKKKKKKTVKCLHVNWKFTYTHTHRESHGTPSHTHPWGETTTREIFAAIFLWPAFEICKKPAVLSRLRVCVCVCNLLCLCVCVCAGVHCMSIRAPIIARKCCSIYMYWPYDYKISSDPRIYKLIFDSRRQSTHPFTVPASSLYICTYMWINQVHRAIYAV